MHPGNPPEYEAPREQDFVQLLKLYDGLLKAGARTG